MRGPGHPRRRMPAGAVVAAALLAGMLGCRGTPDGPPERIVLVVIDTLRRDHVSCYGGEVPTPNIDGLAARGQRFPHALGSFHQTTMSMGALFTGRTPSIESGDPARTLPWRDSHWCGMARFAPGDASRGPCLPASLPTLGERLQASGYETLGVASNALLFGDAGFARGFDAWAEVGDIAESRPGPGRATSRERMRAWAESRAAGPVHEAVLGLLERRRGDRFFLYVHYMDVHDYALRDLSYAQGVAEADAAVGRLLAALEALELLEGSVVVLAADHGERLEETYPVRAGNSHAGNPSFGAVLRTPLIVSPARFTTPAAPVRSEDLHRMLLELAGVSDSPPSDLARDELLVTEMHWQTYRQGRWKSTWSRHDDRRLLFDLVADPQEQHDLAAEQPEVLERHGRRIAALASRLAASNGLPAGPLRAAERQRLRVLGYLADEDEGEGESEGARRPEGPRSGSASDP